MKLTHIGYVLESFPQNSETFVINEIWGMLRFGFEVSIVPRLSAPEDSVQHERYLEIRNSLFVSEQDSSFSFYAFFFGLLYGSQVNLGLRPLAVLGRFKNALKIARHFKALERAKPTLLITHFGYDNAVVSAMYSKKYGVVNILWMHGSDMHTVPHRSIKWITHNCATVVTHSDFARRLIYELGVRTPVAVSCLGVDLERFRLECNRIKSSVPVIACVARLGHGKDHDFLLRVFKAVKRIVPATELWLIGDGPNRRFLEQQVESNGISDVVFFGNQPQSKVQELLLRSWVCALFSKNEGFPVSLMEAHACGLPTVASKVGGVAELIDDGKTGFVVDGHCSSAEEHAAKCLVSLLTDSEQRNEMGRNARQRAVLNFSELDHFDRMRQLVHRLLAEKP